MGMQIEEATMSVSLSKPSSVPVRRLSWVAVPALLFTIAGCTRNLAGETIENCL